MQQSLAAVEYAIRNLVAPVLRQRRGEFAQILQIYLRELSTLKPLRGQEFCDLIHQRGEGQEYRNLCVNTLAFFLPNRRRSIQANWGKSFEAMPESQGFVLALHIFAMRLLRENIRLRQENALLKKRPD